MKDVEIAALPGDDAAARDEAALLLFTAFDDPQRYGPERLRAELSVQPPPFYRHFLVARRGGTLLAVGGIKAADWASDTHILYLSAVAAEARGQGIARALIMARLAWAMENFGHGRVLVSTARPRRFARFGFKLVGRQARQERRLMLLEF